jgi:hypothetical protein
MKAYCEHCVEKPIAPQARKFCYQGPGTGWQQPRVETKKVGFPNQFWRVPKWVEGTDSGRHAESPHPAKYLLMNDLIEIHSPAWIGAARALERCMSAFHMTS